MSEPPRDSPLRTRAVSGISLSCVGRRRRKRSLSSSCGTSEDDADDVIAAPAEVKGETAGRASHQRCDEARLLIWELQGLPPPSPSGSSCSSGLISLMAAAA